MKTALVYLFSGTGNTAKCVDIFKRKFEESGVATTVFKVTADLAEAPSADDFDMVGFAYPVHGFNAPQIILDFARALPRAATAKNFFVVKSSGEPLALNNISSIKLASILKKKGYTLQAEYHYAMPYNMIFRHDDGFAAKLYSATKVLAARDAENLLGGEKHLLKRIPFGRAIAFLFRIEHVAMKINGKYFKVDDTKCIHCGKCAKNCPEHNITIKDGKFEFGKECVMCTRCSFGCPTDAINICLLNGWRVNGTYDFSAPESAQSGKHANYCKKSYARYFARADEIRAEINA